MGGDYTTLKIDQGPSSEGKDHRFRAVLHHFTFIVFAEEASCSLSDEHRHLLCQILFSEVPQIENRFVEVHDLKKMEEYLTN